MDHDIWITWLWLNLPKWSCKHPAAPRVRRACRRSDLRTPPGFSMVHNSCGAHHSSLYIIIHHALNHHQKHISWHQYASLFGDQNHSVCLGLRGCEGGLFSFLNRIFLQWSEGDTRIHKVSILGSSQVWAIHSGHKVLEERKIVAFWVTWSLDI